MMTARPKSKREQAPVLPVVRSEGDSKDQFLRRLELQQTVNAKTIERLERNCDEVEALRAGFSLLYDRSPVGYITIDKRGHIYNANSTLLYLLEYKREKLFHLPLTFLVHPEDLKNLLAHLCRCESEKELRVVSDVRLQSKRKAFVPVQLISVPFKTDGREKLFLTVVADMTEQNKHAQALAESKEYAEAIVQTVRNPLAVLDPELRILSVNRAFTEFFKRPSQYIRGRFFEAMLNLWWSGNQLRTELEKVLVKDQPLEAYRIDVQPPGVGRRIFLVNARKLYQKENQPQRLLVSLEDVTELEVAREGMRKANEELEQRVIARTQALSRSYEQMEAFCYSIAHDLRAPLRSMTGFSQLLSEGVASQMNQEVQDFASRIQHSAERMDELIRDLLSYGRLNTTPMATSDVDPDKIFEDVLAQHERDIRDKKAKVRKKGRLPPLRGHPAVLHAILSNLIGNALKFVAPGVRPKVEVSAETTGDWVRVWVADNGIGIAQENQEKIFGVFQRLHPIDRYPGTGIGLAIVAKGVERMGGRLGLLSEVGKGSRFWFELPTQGGEAPKANSEDRFRPVRI